MASSTSSSGRPSSFFYNSKSKWRYDVFLSFRGEDTRNSFTDHLYWALDRGNIKTFRDDEELPRGEEISPQLLKAIETSRIAIIVFSKTYAHSKWCLDELVKIMECEKEKGQKVFPIFYHVEPSEVRNQTRIYGEAFNNHERNADEEKMKKIQEWKIALRKAGNLSGFHLQDGSESKFIEEIIGDIRTLIPKMVHVGENIVGMDDNLKKVRFLIDSQSNEVSMVGIYGIGGIGKTTIAKVVYYDMLDEFKHHSFLENVREKSKDDCGLLQLQEKLLSDILMEKNMKLSNINEGIHMIKSKCCLEKVLIVLDDVDSPKQLKFLAPNFEWFHRGSIIIVTTRNKRCLDWHKSYPSYEAKGLAHNQAMELFCWNAFQQHHPKENYVGLSNRILNYAKGLPLALVVLGSFLFQRDVDEWENTLHKLKTNPLEDIQNVLQISYDGLDDKCKKLFLDIACFFKDQDETFVTRILEGCNFYPKIGLRVLDERCLISIQGGTIRMHDLLQEMGWAIVRQKYPEHPGKWSRLWDYEDIKSVFTKDMGTKKIEGVFLNHTTGKPIQIAAEAFRKMNQLRLLIVKNKRVNLSQDFELPCHDLAYFCWHAYPLESMPSNFHADNLVELDLQFSNIKYLWEGIMCARKLKVINLSFSRHLVDITSISSVQNLEILILKGCTRLKILPRNLHQLERLRTLSCVGCSRMKRFPEIKGDMGRLRELNLSLTGITELPSSIRQLHGLEDLDLSYCINLTSLPNSIYSLSSLQTLLLNGCSDLKGFPDINIGSLKALELLDLSGCKNIESLPVSIGDLSSLKTLGVENGRKLKAILEVNLGLDLGSLRSLNLTSCILKAGVIWSNGCFTSLKTLNPQCSPMEGEIINYISPLSSLVELSVRNSCFMEQYILNDGFHLSSLQILSLRNAHLMKREFLSDIFHLSSLVNLSLSNCKLQEERIPNDIWKPSSLLSLSLSNCNLMEGKILKHVCYLSSLEKLSLKGSHFSSIPAGISRLSNLRALNLSHCKNFVQIPELPSSLRLLDAHCSDGISLSPSFLPIHSLINSFKSKSMPVHQISVGGSVFKGNGISIVIPRNSGILEWMRYPSMGTDEVTFAMTYCYEIKLPPNWYEDNYLLGFALWCVYPSSAHESQNKSVHVFEIESDDGSALKFSCHLMIRGNYRSSYVDLFSFDCSCVNDGASDTVWVICYPKVAIEQRYCTKQWTHFMASFHGSLRMEQCGIRLIYAEDYEQKHTTMAQDRTSHGNFGGHGLVTEDTNSKAHIKRSLPEQSPVQESHNTRFTIKGITKALFPFLREDVDSLKCTVQKAGAIAKPTKKE